MSETKYTPSWVELLGAVRVLELVLSSIAPHFLPGSGGREVADIALEIAREVIRKADPEYGACLPLVRVGD